MPTDLTSKDDSALIAACSSGDADAWEELIRRYRRLIYSIPFASGLGADEADDVFQRVAIVLVESVGKIRDAQSLPAWIVTTTRRECWALRRQASRSRSFEEGEAEAMPAEAPDVAEAIDRVAAEHAVQVALGKLGEPCRGLLTALYVEEPTPSYEEIARRLGRPIGSLGPTRSRCLEKLRKAYDP